MPKELPEHIQQKFAILCAEFVLEYKVPRAAVIRFVQELMHVVSELMEDK